MLVKLWNDIQLVYENLFKNEPGYIDNMVILSRDNYYFIHHKPPFGVNTEITVEKDYNLVRIWGGDVPYDMVNYKIKVEINGEVELDENYKVELTYKIITRLLREVKLEKIGV